MKKFSAVRCGLAAGMVFLAAVAMAPGMARAATTKGRGLFLPAALTSLTALPDSEIAVVTGTGLRGPAVSGTAEPRAAITLWDELRPAVQQNNLSSGNSTVTVNGVVQ